MKLNFFGKSNIVRNYEEFELSNIFNTDITDTKKNFELSKIRITADSNYEIFTV